MPDGRSTPRAPLQTYFSASADKRDQLLLSELRTWLVNQQNCGWLRRGSCRAEIAPGDRKAELALAHVRQADLIFVLLSVEYLQSADCIAELVQAIDLHTAKLAQLVPLHLRALPIGELPATVHGQRLDLRQWQWLPKSNAGPIDHDKRAKRDDVWQKVEQEVRALAMQLCEGPQGDLLTERELALFGQNDEGGIGAFLDRFGRVIGAGLRSGAGRSFSPIEENDIARRLYWDLFCADEAEHVLFKPERDRSFAHFVFKLAHILGERLVRFAGPPSYIYQA